jgi:hypothetical protein
MRLYVYIATYKHRNLIKQTNKQTNNNNNNKNKNNNNNNNNNNKNKQSNCTKMLLMHNPHSKYV